ncbi:MAG: DUF3592 domain-containing protein [Planctomycetota bacterium]
MTHRDPPKRRSKLSARSKEDSRGSQRAMLVVFIVVSTAILLWVSGVPLYRYSKLEGWVETPCTLEVARMRAEDDTDGTTMYYLDLEYRYSWDDRSYVGDRYHLGKVKNWSYGSLSELLGTLKEGSETRCWVDPKSPDQAVLSREFPKSVAVGLIPLLILVMSGYGLFSSRAARTASDERRDNLDG